MNRENCDELNCADCFLLGNQGPDWPRRAQCRKLEALRLATWEDEGGPVPPATDGALTVVDEPVLAH